MIRMITLILPLCCLFNPERHELARGIYIIREVYIAMFVIRITQLSIAFNHSYHCLLPGRAFASLYVLLFLEEEAEIGGRE